MGLPPRVQVLPCGQCIGCRLERSRQWAIRCVHHAQCYEHNAFITLTYDPEHLETRSLDHRDWQLFMKRLRKFASIELKKRVGLYQPDLPASSRRETRDGGAESQISYYMAGEYGTKNRRPHFHACLFNYQFQDRKYYSTTSTTSKLYTSNTLNNLWGKGFTSIGDVNIQSAAYVARYIISKQTGPNAWQYYQHIDPDTGEIHDLRPEYNRMSLKTPIGKNWFNQYNTDVYPQGIVRTRTGAFRSPRYYDKLFQQLDEVSYDEMKKQREEEGRARRGDNTPQRLAAKERVQRAQLNQLLRKI